MPLPGGTTLRITLPVNVTYSKGLSPEPLLHELKAAAAGPTVVAIGVVLVVKSLVPGLVVEVLLMSGLLLLLLIILLSTIADVCCCWGVAVAVTVVGEGAT